MCRFLTAGGQVGARTATPFRAPRYLMSVMSGLPRVSLTQGSCVSRVSLFPFSFIDCIYLLQINVAQHPEDTKAHIRESVHLPPFLATQFPSQKLLVFLVICASRRVWTFVKVHMYVFSTPHTWGYSVHSTVFCAFLFPLTMYLSKSVCIKLPHYFKKKKKGFQKEGEGGRKRGRKSPMWERNINHLPLAQAPTRDQTRNPGMCPDQEFNKWPFALWDNKQLSHTSQSVFPLP